MSSHDPLKSDEARDAGWEAGKGGLVGAAKWGIAAAILGVAGHYWSPVYRKTTVQFKVYVQLSAMVLGGMIVADSRLRQYEAQVRTQKRWLREKAKWERYEAELRDNEK
ncbi:hypothetical protein PT974_06768 [Cladobotryum mycophilum]|uniref:HIG1 domain-containing protein n=1 Tax=Cladobotryum mycophilum TaxID=491253 RepID=A0ABR0SME5_9HYPO